ncbi:PREDICTED: serendipity locus protein alpha [Papilio xuthus]|uniref:Serendipity locus protein alpha n=1 Tax=Papilio xuthus TaxID=66420 RepID=A0AAJ7EK13_PAPXU|nr:PREDICTED: serendipity locus protein alpha [Papilio xuthus]
MDIQILNINQDLPKEVESATKLLVDSFLSNLYPFLQKLGCKIGNYLRNDELRENVTNIHKVFALCVSQINKCYVSFIDILKLENHEQLLLLESRRCTLERLSWCCSRLVVIEDMLEGITNNNGQDSALDESIFDPPLYFVNWIDQTFDDLKTLTDLVSLSDADSEQYEQWTINMVECLKSLHNSIDELLLSAMTLCRYCLPADQHAIKARCQVVLRETKTLLSDVIDGDLDIVFNNSDISLNLPIKPSNVNVLIDVLRGALYALETNTSRGVLALLVHCFSYSISPVDVLQNHYKSNMGTCDCLSKGEDETKSCDFVKEFDLHNERLLQIGSFAVSCSADDKRILSIRSNLASLEALDPHLVPALIMAPESHHSMLLCNTWNKEVLEIKHSIFLIVDPAAFSEKAKQVMQQKLLEIIKDNVYENNKICSVINIGCVVYEFFDVYDKYEPDAIKEREQLIPLLSDLNKVQLECKVVSNLLSSGSDFIYKVKKSSKPVTFEQMLKRLKLLYTIINKINKLLRPEEENNFFDEETIDENGTYTVYKVNNETCVHSKANLSRSVFARTNIRTPFKYPLFKLTKHLKQKNLNSNFSARLDELCNSKVSKRDSVSCFYSPRKRPSLRKTVLNRHQLTFEQDMNKVCEDNTHIDVDLQISEVLKQINNLTSTFSSRPFKAEFSKEPRILDNQSKGVNKEETIFKNLDILMDGIPEVNVSSLSISQPSNVTTLERLNDLEFVESKLTDLRVLQLETNL